MAAARSDPAIGVGPGRHRMEKEGREALQREADAVEGAGDPVCGSRNRTVPCAITPGPEMSSGATSTSPRPWTRTRPSRAPTAKPTGPHLLARSASTLKPASPFMDAIRERLSTVPRAGGRTARNGSSHTTGAPCSPRVLIAPISICRVHDRFFNRRTCTHRTAQGPGRRSREDPDAQPVDAGHRSGHPRPGSQVC